MVFVTGIFKKYVVDGTLFRPKFKAVSRQESIVDRIDRISRITDLI